MKEIHSSKNSLRTLIVFCLVVFFIVTISLTYRFVKIAKMSRFDDSYLFTIAFIHNKELDLVGLTSDDKRLSHLRVRGIQDMTQARRSLGVFVDGEIYLSQPFESPEKTDRYISDALFKKNNTKTSINSYDLIRLLINLKRIPSKHISSEDVKLPLDETRLEVILKELFTDKKISEGNVTIAIRNGTNIVGLGTRLERAINIMGGTVIAVSNADSAVSTSQIEYVGEKTDTVKRLEQLLSMPSVQLSKQSLSDIIIFIGKDRVDQIHY